MRSLRVSFRALLLCSALVACADITPPLRPTTLDYMLAESTGALLGSPITFITQPGPALVKPPFAVLCPFNASASLFVCAEQKENGMTFNESFQLLDALGAPLTTWDSSRTETVRTIRAVDGPWLIGANQDTVYPNIRVRSDRTLTGLLSGTRVVNGRDSLTRTLTAVSGAPSQIVSEIVVTNNFHPRVRGLPGSFPAAGTISVARWTSTVAMPGGPPGASYVMTFDGTAVVKWVRNISGVVTNCTYNYSLGASAICQ